MKLPDFYKTAVKNPDEKIKVLRKSFYKHTHTTMNNLLDYIT